MTAPYNYLLPNIGNPFESVVGGVKTGLALNEAQMQQEAQARALAQQQQQQQVIQALVRNPKPTAEDYGRASLLLPANMREQIKQSWEMRSSERQQAELAETGQVLAALHSGKADVAVSLLKRRAEALKNSGAPEQQIDATERQIKIAETDPNFARSVIGMTVAALPGGQTLLENLSKLNSEQRAQELHAPAVASAQAEAITKTEQAKYAPQVAQATATKAVADATTAQVQARFAERGALLDLEKKGWDIKAIKADIDIRREANRISAMNASISREGNLLKQQELKMKITEAQQKVDEKVREKAAEAEQGAASIDNALNTIQRLTKNTKLNSVVGSIEGRLPAVISDEAADAIALIDTLNSQAFLAQVPQMKGMGQLTEREGEKLQTALQNLSRKQSEGQFRANLNEASRLLLKARTNLSRKTGVPLAAPDTPAAEQKTITVEW